MQSVGTFPAMTAVVGRERHAQAVERLRASYDALPPDAPVRLSKATSNLFRVRSRTEVHGLDFLWIPALPRLVHDVDPFPVELPAYDRGDASVLPDEIKLSTVHAIGVEVSAQGKGRAIAALQDADIGIVDLEVWR